MFLSAVKKQSKGFKKEKMQERVGKKIQIVLM